MDIFVSDKPYKPLKDYQFSVFCKAIEQLITPRVRFIIQMPTGSGKTRTAMEIISHYFNSSPHQAENILWLTQSRELCEQAFEGFLDTWPHVSTKPLRVIRFWGEEKEIPHKKERSNFIIASLQKLRSQLHKKNPLIDYIKENTSLIIIDEAHRVTATGFKKTTEAFIHIEGSGTQVIGLTATPGRSAVDEKANTKLAKFFFEEIVKIDTPGDETDIEYLRKKRVLSHINYDPLETSRNYILNKKVREFIDLPDDFIDKLGRDGIRNAEIIGRLKQEVLLGKQILFFSCGVKHSQIISADLQYGFGINAAHLDGNTPKDERASIIKKFKEGEIKVLCNYGVLTTGFDAPKTDVVFISRPTNSIVLYSQMIGRGLRGPEIGGTETCKVIDVIDNIQGFSDETKVYDYFRDYYES